MFVFLRRNQIKSFTLDGPTIKLKCIIMGQYITTKKITRPYVQYHNKTWKPSDMNASCANKNALVGTVVDIN